MTNPIGVQGKAPKGEIVPPKGGSAVVKLTNLSAADSALVEIATLRVKPGDTIIVRAPESVQTEHFIDELSKLRDLYPRSRIVVLPTGVSLEALDEAQMRDAGWERLNPNPPATIEQMVRDLLEKAIQERLVAPEKKNWADPDPQIRTSGELVGAANLLQKLMRDEKKAVLCEIGRLTRWSGGGILNEIRKIIFREIGVEFPEYT